MSQLVVLNARDDAPLLPILVRVQQLQARLLEQEDAFASAWNWVDAFLRLKHGAASQLYRMLRQAMMARRALLLLDGTRSPPIALSCRAAACLSLCMCARSLHPRVCVARRRYRRGRQGA